MNPANDIELSLICEVTALFSREAIQHWLFGGWGVDFRLGEVTRPHMDVEFLVWERDLERCVDLLQGGATPKVAVWRSACISGKRTSSSSSI